MIFLIQGTDNYRRELYVSKLRTEYLEAGLETINYSCLEKPSTADFIRSVSTPGFGGRRVTLIKDMSQLESKSEDENEIKLILEALAELPEDSIVIISNKKINGTIKLVKEIKKLDSVEIHEFQEFNEWESAKAAEWIVSLKEFDITRDVAEFFADYIGCNDSSRLHSELERLSTLGAGVTKTQNLAKTKISVELIKQECKARDDVFKLARELALGKTESVREELRRLIANDELHLGTIAAISSSINRYLKLKLLDESPAHRARDIQAQILGVSPGRLHFMKQEAAPMRVLRLEELSEKLLEIERTAKTRGADLTRALSILVAQSSPNFLDLIRNSPLKDTSLSLSRDTSPMRDI